MKALDHMIKEGLFEYSGDTWGSEACAENYRSMDDVNGQVNYKDEIFVVSHKNGGGAGMGAYPPSVKIIRIKPPINVVIMESEVGWGSKVDEVKTFDDMKAAEEFVKEFNKGNNEAVTPSWYMYAYIDKKA